MAFPCADCELLNTSSSKCRITNQARPSNAVCTLAMVQRLALWMQAKRLVAAGP